MSTRVDQRPSNRWLYVAIAMLMALSVSVQAVRDGGWTPYVPANPTMWVQSAAAAQRLALGFDNLVADVYWIRAVTYYGSKRQLTTSDATAASRTSNFDSLYPLLNLVTSLDPHFKIAYRFGAIFLCEAYPNGPGRTDLAIALLEHGIDSDFGRWEYFQDIGFVYYWWLHDYQKAAEWFKRAGEQPGAATWLPALAATTLAEGGDRRSSRLLWTNIVEGTDLEWLKTQGTHRLQQLDAMDVLDDLNRRAKNFMAREGRPPRSWREFATAERVVGNPVDPTGVPYVFDPAYGFGVDSLKSALWPLPKEGGEAAKPPS
jgi:hypothetical protein